jgi:cytochrome c-type biogenesis protein CcmH
MNTFIVIAAFMAASAAAAVVFPFLRNRQTRVFGLLVGVLMMGAAGGLYPLWSNWNWHASAQKPALSPDVLAMVAKLAKHMQEQPNDIAGWIMLGRSYMALERVDDAYQAYDRAAKLDPNNVDAMMGLGESLVLRAGGDITPAAAELFDHAATLAPNNPKALLYGGFAAAVRGNRALARSRWQALKALHPPEKIEAMLDQRIAELGTADLDAGSAAAPAAGAPGSPATRPADAGSSADAGSAGGGSAQATINLSIAPALKSRLTGEAPLFVFAREPGGQGPPLAAKRLSVAAIGTQIQLSPADSMVPGRVLVSGQKVSITARISFSGQPLPAPGDLYGELTYDVGRDGARDLVIDRVAQ